MLIVVNAKAGTTDTERIERAAAVLRDGGQDLDIRRCAGTDDLERALDDHPDGGETVVAAGGDGSIHRLVQTLRERGELERRVVGLLPLGTGNDLARNLGIPREPDAAAETLLRCAPRGLDLLTDDAGGVVLNAAHVGAGAVAADSATRFKPYLKAAAFPVGAVLAGLRTTGWRLRVETDGQLVADDKLLMVALNNASAIAGGTARLAPDAEPHDGRLDLTVAAATGPVARVGYALGLRDGTHRHRDDVRHMRATTVTISGDPFLINTDGDVTAPVARRTWTVSPRAWRLVAPAG